MSQPRISVVMPVWNGDQFLAEAVDSILAQSFTDWELIVVDGGSTDRTLEILSSYGDPRIRVVHAPGTGIVPARNIGISHALAAWIACNDADDISLPNRLQVQWDAVNRVPDAVLSYTDVELIGEVSASIGRARLPRTQAFFAMKLCFQFPTVHSTVMFKKEIAMAVGGYEGQTAEDYGLVGKLIESGRSVGIPQKLLKFRLNPVSATHRDKKITPAIAEKIGRDHCERYMRLSPEAAQRAYAVLSAPRNDRHWKEWAWFVRYCVPKMRWKSAEMFGWIAWQSVKLGV